MTGGQVCAAIAAVAFLVGGGAVLVAMRLTDVQVRWLWFGGAGLGLGASVLSVFLTGIEATSGTSLVVGHLLGNTSIRALGLALIVALSSLASVMQTYLCERRWQLGGADLFPAAVLAGLGVWLSPAFDGGQRWGGVAVLLLSFTLVATGLMLYSAGRMLDAGIRQGTPHSLALRVAFVGLTGAVLAMVGVNWRVWGTPFGAMSAGLALLAAWLIGVSGLALQHRFAWGSAILIWLNAALLVVIALSVRWRLPFG